MMDQQQLKREILLQIFALILALVGYTLAFVYLPWQAVVGLFLIFWGNNVGMLYNSYKYTRDRL